VVLHVNDYGVISNVYSVMSNDSGVINDRCRALSNGYGFEVTVLVLL
jgi:hypothetical protein